MILKRVCNKTLDKASNSIRNGLIKARDKGLEPLKQNEIKVVRTLKIKLQKKTID